MEAIKHCKKCNRDKPLDAFNNDHSRPDGKFPNCRDCNRAYIHALHEAKPELQAKYAKKTYGKHGAKYNAQRRARTASDPEYRERRQLIGRKTYARNADKRKAYTAEYQRNHPDKTRKWKKEYDSRNRAKRLAYQKIWRKSSREYMRSKCAARRALRKGVPVSAVDRTLVFARDNGICHICKKKVNPKSWHLDHLIPLSKGGEHTYQNVAVAHPFCNLSRGNRGAAQLRLDL